MEPKARRSEQAVTKWIAKVVVVAMMSVGLLSVVASPATASGCTWPPCGAVTNHTNQSIKVRWSSDIGWRTGWVNPGGTIGGYYNDGIDVDDLWIPAYTCFDISGWPLGQNGGSGGRWFKIASYETAVVNRAYGC